MAMVQWIDEQSGQTVQWHDGGFDPSLIVFEAVPNDSTHLLELEVRYKFRGCTFTQRLIEYSSMTLATAKDVLTARLRIAIAKALRVDELSAHPQYDFFDGSPEELAILMGEAEDAFK